jgi:uncharacterized glyoxalase superfamily protein PhnB
VSPSKVANIKAFLPAKDFARSKQFYLDLGFREVWDSSDSCELEIEGHSFILTSGYIPQHAENCMMSLNVEDADPWWTHIEDVGLVKKYDIGMARPPELQPWGVRVLYLSDPSGVLWHIAERRSS